MPRRTDAEMADLKECRESQNAPVLSKAHVESRVESSVKRTGADHALSSSAVTSCAQETNVVKIDPELKGRVRNAELKGVKETCVATLDRQLTGTQDLINAMRGDKFIDWILTPPYFRENGDRIMPPLPTRRDDR